MLGTNTKWKEEMPRRSVGRLELGSHPNVYVTLPWLNLLAKGHSALFLEQQEKASASDLQNGNFPQKQPRQIGKASSFLHLNFVGEVTASRGLVVIFLRQKQPQGQKSSCHFLVGRGSISAFWQKITIQARVQTRLLPPASG